MFYVNTKMQVIRKVTPGKFYQNTLEKTGVKSLEDNLPPGTHLTISYVKDGNIFNISQANSAQHQSAQKGGLCWYYASKFKRFGKFFMGQERAYEKIISDYRKNCTVLTEIKAIEDSFVDQFNETLETMTNNSTQEQPQEKIFAQFFLKNIPFTTPTIPNLLNSFLANTQHNELTYFTLERQGKALIAAINAVSKELSFNIEEAVKEALKTSGCTLPVNELSLDELSGYYDRVIIQHIWELQGYCYSTWHPNKGVNDLIEELRHFICIAEIDYNLLILRSGQPSLQFANRDEEGYLLCDVAPAENAEPGEETHIIRIIGADVDNVYFIDPNDDSPPKQPRIVHKIPYLLFCHTLLDTNGVSAEKSMSASIFPPVLYHIKSEASSFSPPLSPKRVSKRPSSPKIEIKDVSLQHNNLEGLNPSIQLDSYKKAKVQKESNGTDRFYKHPVETKSSASNVVSKTSNTY